MLTVTPSALEKLKKIQQEEQIPQEEGLKIQVVPGGCSGSSYEMYFGPQENDESLDFEGLKVFISKDHLTFFQGAAIDFEGTGINGKFRIHNPNVKKTCGCGDSFSS